VDGVTNKLTDNDFVKYITSYEIIGLTETWIGGNNDMNFTDYLSNYVPYVLDALPISSHGRCSGGIVLLVRHSLNLFVKWSKICENVVFILLDKKLFNLEKDLLLGCVYIQPEGSTWYRKRATKNGLTILLESLLDILDTLGDVYVLIGGDYNAWTGESPDYVEDTIAIQLGTDHFDFLSDKHQPDRCSCDKTVNQFGTHLINICSALNLHILNGRCGTDAGLGDYTFISHTGTSVVDYVIASGALFTLCSSFCVESRSDSDHMPVTCTLRACVARDNQDSAADVAQDHRLRWNDRRAEEYIDNLCSQSIVDMLNESAESAICDIDSAVSLFTEAMISAAQSMNRQCSNNHSNTQPWYDGDCIFRRQERDRLLKVFRNDKCQDNLDNYIFARNKYSCVLRTKRECHYSRVCDNLLDNLQNGKTFWNIIKTMQGSPRVGKLTAGISMDAWVHYFRTMYELPDREVESGVVDIEEQDVSGCSSYILDAPISREEISTAIEGLKNNKSPGIDGTIIELFKCGKDFLIPYLEIILNSAFESSHFPKSWCVGVLIPLHKKGSVSEPNNYRGITLLSAFSKIYTSILNNRLVFWANAYDKLVEAQAGFRKDYTTLDNIFVLQSMIQRYLGKKRGKLYALFVDFRKAFDLVDRGKLWSVLKRKGVSSKMYNALQSIYSCVKCCVKDKGNFSEEFPCMIGLRQGCILSPFLFSIFINELSSEIENSCSPGLQFHPYMVELFLLLFADDVVLLSSTIYGLQKRINALQEFCGNYHLTVNLDKTRVVVFKNGGILSRTEKWYFDGNQLECVSSYTYLGVIFSKTLSWNKHITNASVQAKKVLFGVFRSLSSLKPLPYDIFFKIFDSKISPILLYGSEIWGFDNVSAVESIHLGACKRFLYVKSSSPNHVVYGECGRYPLLGTNTIFTGFQIC